MWLNRVCLTFLQLAWLVDSISADNQTGSLEFSTPPADADSFFPLRFTSGNLSSRDCFVADIQ